MRRAAVLVVAALGAFTTVPVRAVAPDYSQWNRILAAYYDAERGMDYAALKARDAGAVQKLRRDLGRVNASTLSAHDRLAYWINVYNINTVATILEHYPVASIRDISTDVLIRLNVFKKPRVPTARGLLSLNDVENDEIRSAFRDPRIHFAINCAARSCPPLRREAYEGSRINAQLDNQTAAFLNGPNGARFRSDGTSLRVHVTKIMDWFEEDFDRWAGGEAKFLARYVSPAHRRLLETAKTIRFSYDSYDWALNDWKR